MIDLWIIGMAFVVLVTIEVLWALDLLVAGIRRCRRRRRWGWLLRSGDLWLALFNLSLGVLHGWFAWICFRDPFRRIEGATALLIVGMAAFAVLAWWYLPRPPIEEDMP